MVSIIPVRPTIRVSGAGRYAALKWVAEHAQEIGADGNRIAIAGNSVGGNMTAALALMSKDRSGPKISYQVLLIPATDASVDTRSYQNTRRPFLRVRS